MLCVKAYHDLCQIKLGYEGNVRTISAELDRWTGHGPGPGDRFVNNYPPDMFQFLVCCSVISPVDCGLRDIIALRR